MAKLSASDGTSGDFLGWPVAINGDIVVAGAVGEDGGPGDPLPNAGAAYVFERNEGGANNWGEVAKLTASDAEDGDNFSLLSLSVNGDVVVAGAAKEDGGPGDPRPDAGAAYVFERNEGGPNKWGEVAKLTASDAEAENFFGVSVAVSDDTIIAGASGKGGGSGNPLTNVGAAYIFERNEGGDNKWGEVAKLTASDMAEEDALGTSVAVSGDTIAASAPGEDGGPGDPLPESGAVYIFGRDEGGANKWEEVAKLTASDAEAEDSFGISIAVNGDTIVSGAPTEDGGYGDPLPESGAVYVFGRDKGGENSWGEIAKLTASDAEDKDGFGWPVAVSNDTVVVGSAWLRPPGNGAAYAFYGVIALEEGGKIYLPVVIRD